MLSIIHKFCSLTLLMLMVCLSPFSNETPDIEQRISNQPYPKIAMLWAPLRGDWSVESIAKHDLIMMRFGLKLDGNPTGLATGFTPESIENAKERIAQIRKINPNAVLIGDQLFYEYPENWLSDDHPWWLRENGEKKQFWPGTYRMDWNNEDYLDHAVKQTIVLKEVGVDGVFYDNIRNEPKPWITFLSKVRDAVGDDFLILANCGYDVGSYDFASPFLNGMMYESGWSHNRTEWGETILKMQHTQSLLREPKISIIERFEEIRSHAGWPGDEKREQKPNLDPKSRYWSLCYSLIVGDYYYLFSDNTSHKHDWYPEYDQKIGKPLCKGERINSHVWKRQYDNAVVYANLPGSQQPYTVTLDHRAVDTFTKQKGKEFIIPPGEGRILLADSKTSKKSDFLLGSHQVDITPPIGWRMAGNYYEIFSDGVHDPLYAKAMIMNQNDTTAVIIICDLSMVPKPITNAAREIISSKLGIPFQNISIAATHTHAGPEYHGSLWGLFTDEINKKTDLEKSFDYQEFLIDSCVQAAVQASKNKQPVTLQHGIAALDGIAFNRRFHMKDGTVRFNPGKKNPNIVKPAGPVDTDFHLLFFKNQTSNKPIALFSTFAVHTAVFGGSKFGADFPGGLQNKLQNKYGDEFFSLYGQGTSGDTNHINVSTRMPDNTSDFIATKMAETIISAEPHLQPIPHPSLAVKTKTIQVPFYPIDDEKVKQAYDTFNTQKEKRPSFMDLVYAWKVINTQLLKDFEGDEHTMEIHAVRISDDVALVTWPHEIFVELGMNLKKRSPFENTIITTLANDFDFYIATRKAYGEGSYEITTSSVLPGSGEALVEATLKVLNDLK